MKTTPKTYKIYANSEVFAPRKPKPPSFCTKHYKIMPFNYRWARGEDKARELAEKVSGSKDWHRCENTAKCGDVTCHRHEYMLDGDEYYRQYWLCYQRTDQYPKTGTAIGFCTDGELSDLPIKRLKDGLEKIYK